MPGIPDDGERLREAAIPLGPDADAALLDLIGDRRLVLLGEASHGTEDFYAERARVTRLLIAERGFSAVAAEADWPDAHRVNRWVRGVSVEPGPEAALGDFTRFPAWMWRNTVVADFCAWLRAHNEDTGAGVGFYGLDLYSLSASIDAVLAYLERVDPEAGRRARERYACFEHFGEDPQAYGYATALRGEETCEPQVVEQLLELQERAADYARRDGRLREDEHFFAEQNARLVRNAEQYYRCMFRGRSASWNLRDRHMADTLDALGAHGGRAGRPAKVVVWAHNSHVGDARATEMGRHRGELTLGQLARERHRDHAVLIGFSTYSGTVTAAHDWGEPAETMAVRPALGDSWEALFHSFDLPAFVVRLGAGGVDALESRLERAIGVIYRPSAERLSHYFEARLDRQFDAVIHLDETRAVRPLAPAQPAQAAEAPETFPHGA